MKNKYNIRKGEEQMLYDFMKHELGKMLNNPIKQIVFYESKDRKRVVSIEVIFKIKKEEKRIKHP